MVFDTSNKKIQYITIDSSFITSSSATVAGYAMGGNNNFSVNFGTKSSTTTSNIFVQEMRNVIGLKVVDFYITQIASFENGTNNTANTAVKYVDILCPDIPDVAQILDERKSRIFARIPIERDFSGTSNIVANDKQWKSFDRQTNYFNPLSITKLNFQMWEMTGPSITPASSALYQPLQPDASFYMILEVTTIDNEVITLPKEDTSIKIVQAIESLENKFVSLIDQFPGFIKSVTPVVPEPESPVDVALSQVPIVQPPAPVPPPPVQKIDNKIYWIIAILFILIIYLFNSKAPSVPQRQ